MYEWIAALRGLVNEYDGYLYFEYDAVWRLPCCPRSRRESLPVAIAEPRRPRLFDGRSDARISSSHARCATQCCISVCAEAANVGIDRLFAWLDPDTDREGLKSSGRSFAVCAAAYGQTAHRARRSAKGARPRPPSDSRLSDLVPGLWENIQVAAPIISCASSSHGASAPKLSELHKADDVAETGPSVCRI